MTATDSAAAAPAPAPAGTPPAGAGRFTPQRLRDIAASTAVGAAALSLLELISRMGWVSDLVLPAPTQVAAALADGFATGLYWTHIGSTVLSTASGFAIAALAGVLGAGLLASMPRVERILMPYVVAFQTLPKIAIAPLVVLWFGFGNLGKTTIVVIVCVFPILINALQGLRIRDRDQYELMRSLGASRWQLFRYLRVPNAVPYIFAGLHVGVVFALIGAVVAEFIGSRAGLGYILLLARSQFNVPGVFAILFLLMLLGLAFYGTMRWLERRVAFWSKDLTET
ncbi:ABC transporter permease [Nocardiopsis coralliicola]